MSIYSKYGLKAKYIDSGISPRMKKNKSGIFHRKMQSKQHRFNQDWYWVEMEEDRFLEVGIDKEQSHIDYPDWYDREKDGNNE